MERRKINGTLFYTPKEIGRMLGIQKSKTYTLLREYLDFPDTAPFSVVLVGKQMRVPIHSFDAWMDKINSVNS